MMKQTITVVLNLKPGQQPYALLEDTRPLGLYAALEHFFTDIDYEVASIGAKVEPQAPEYKCTCNCTIPHTRGCLESNGARFPEVDLGDPEPPKS